MKAPISTAIAMAFGLIVLLGYFVDIPILITLRDIFVRWAVLLMTVALIVGIINLVIVHWKKFSQDPGENPYSIILLVAFGLTLLVAGFFGPTSEWSLWIFNHIQMPVEQSLMAILVVILIYSVARMFKVRINLISLIFIATVLLMLILAVPWFGVAIPGLQGPGGIRSFIAEIPAVAGARGILIGIGLGTVATGLRVLIGADRPYGG